MKSRLTGSQSKDGWRHLSLLCCHIYFCRNDELEQKSWLFVFYLMACIFRVFALIQSAGFERSLLRISEWRHETIDGGKMFLKHSSFQPVIPVTTGSPVECSKPLNFPSLTVPARLKLTQQRSVHDELKILCLSHILVNLCLIHNHKLGTLVSVVCLNLSDYTFWLQTNVAF